MFLEKFLIFAFSAFPPAYCFSNYYLFTTQTLCQFVSTYGHVFTIVEFRMAHSTFFPLPINRNNESPFSSVSSFA